MKTFAAFLLCWAAPFGAAAQGTSPSAPSQKPAQTAPAQPPAATQAPAAKIDPAKETAIRKLMEVQGSSDNFRQIIAGISSSMKPMLNSSLPPGEYREKLIDLFFQKFQSKLRVEQVIELIVPVYDKYFAKEEIEGLIQFYQTPLGKKVVSVLPQVLIESQAEAMKLGEKYGRESMVEVLDEHPELKKALEEAAAAPKN